MRPNAYTPEEIRYMKDHAGFVTVSQLARHLDRTEASVSRKADSLALPLKSLGINRTEAGWIMELADGGMPFATIAEKFGLPQWSLKRFIDLWRRERPWP